jgi:hypothetical protein
MKNRDYLISSAMMLLSGVSFAAHSLAQHHAVEVNNNSWSLLSAMKQGHPLLQLGGYWSTLGKTQHINIHDLVGDTFTVTDRNGSNGAVGLGYLIDGNRLDRLQMSYGVDAFYLPKTSVSGLVIQEDFFTNLSYNYNVTHYPLYALAKSTIPIKAIPIRAMTIDAGLGVNFMQLKGFSEQSLDGGITLSDNIFSNHTSTTFSATVGLGIQLANVFGKTPLECGYRFFYLGEGNFNLNNVQVLNTLKTGKAYANAVLCSIAI